MKIAQVVCVFPPYAGGIGTAAANTSKYLANLGHNVTVFTPAYNEKALKKEAVDGYKIERLQPLIKFGNAAIMTQLIKKLNDFDVVHLHLPFIGSAEIILLLKKFKKTKFKLISHYHMDLFGKNLLSKTIFEIEQRFIIPAELKCSDRIIISSKDYILNSRLSNLFKKYYHKFEIIPYGIDTNIFYPTKKDDKLIQKLKLDNKKILLFVGGLDEAHYFKGVNYLLEAFSKLPNNGGYRLIIVGKGNLKKEYENQAKELEISNKTIFTGFVSDEDLPKYYNLADIFVLPSINSGEAFGIVLTEAMACGKPTIASKLPGVREVYGKSQEEIACLPMNADDLANKINQIFSDKKLYAKISNINIYRIKTEYSWEIVAKKTIEVYLKTTK